MKKLLVLFLSLSTGMFAAQNIPDLFELLRRAQQQAQAQARQEIWTVEGLREVAQAIKNSPRVYDKPGVQMIDFVFAFGTAPNQLHLCRSFINSLRPEIERTLASGARDITVQLTLPTGQFNRTVSADYARELIRTFDELNRDMPMEFDRAVDTLKYQHIPSQTELKRQVEAAHATVNGVPVQVAVYKRPVPAFVWALVGVGAAAVAYSAYTYFFAKEEKQKEVKPA